jgi:hypothetical protein
MKIQEISETKRRIILWTIVIVLASLLFFWWGGNVAKTFKDISLPEVPKELQELKEDISRVQEEFTFPVFEDIEIPEEILKELEEYGERE